MKISRFILAGVAVLSLASLPAHATAKTVTGPDKQRLTVSRTTNLVDGQIVRVTGTNFNQKVGIYLAFCELPKKGQLPSNCAGGVNLEGQGASSYWISSNPPKYGVDLAIPFTARGGFVLNLQVVRFIGDTDCAAKKCAILTRADHTLSGYRKADVVIPVSFRK